MNGIDVHIQLVPAREGLAAVFTGIFKSAREVNGFHVILSVHFLSVHLPTTYCARKFLSLPEMITNNLFYITVKFGDENPNWKGLSR